MATPLRHVNTNTALKTRSLCAPQVDLKGAIEAGIRFCKAANGVVLSEGPIPTRFVHRVKVTACVPLEFA